MADEIPISEQANVAGGLMSFDPGTVPGKRPPQFGSKEYLRPELEIADIHDRISRIFMGKLKP
jgi:hypothetical protein